jgi:hypothetical protein
METWSADERWFVGVGIFYCGNPAADHGVVRDFAAAFTVSSCGVQESAPRH